LSRKKTSARRKRESGFSADRTELLNNLWKVQNKHGYIRREDVLACSQALDISAVEVEGVISFYHFFTRKPAGKFAIYLNKSIVAEHKGFERIKEAFEAATGARMVSIPVVSSDCIRRPASDSVILSRPP
jgi:NADH:ubiquinone oxidoreductase subunit E